MSLITLKYLDTFFLSYDEINAEENWKNILSLNPHAKRVHRVQGFDRAHKVCASASTTSRVIIIDGDNYIDDKVFWLEIDDTEFETACFSFKSRNVINNLEYGNGGIKVWDTHTLLNSRTHESGESTDFCWDISYYQVDIAASTTVQNCTPFQAWRSGYREGIKMSYIDGKPMQDPLIDYANIASTNRSKLNVWMTVGRDVENGIWAMLGARQGFYDLYCNTICNTVINDYDWFANKWCGIKDSNPEQLAREFGLKITNEFKLLIPEFSDKESIWFKHVYVNPQRSGLMR
jgi:hypothetical protein